VSVGHYPLLPGKLFHIRPEGKGLRLAATRAGKPLSLATFV